MCTKNGGCVEEVENVEITYEMLNEARRQGRKQGFKEGVTAGIVEGIEEGQYREKINTAYRMMLKGESDEKIFAYTEVTREEVEDFMKKTKKIKKIFEKFQKNQNFCLTFLKLCDTILTVEKIGVMYCGKKKRPKRIK